MRTENSEKHHSEFRVRKGQEFARLQAEYKKRLDAIIQQLEQLNQNNRSAVIEFGSSVIRAVEQMQVAVAMVPTTATNEQVLGLIVRLEETVGLRSSELQATAKERQRALVKEYFLTFYQLCYITRYKTFLTSIFLGIIRLSWTDVHFQGYNDQALQIIANTVAMGMRKIAQPQQLLIENLYEITLSKEYSSVPTIVAEAIPFKLEEKKPLITQLSSAQLLNETDINLAVQTIPTTVIDSVIEIVGYTEFTNTETSLEQVLAKARGSVLNKILLASNLTISPDSTDKIIFSVSDTAYAKVLKWLNADTLFFTYLLYRGQNAENQPVFALHKIALSAYQASLKSRKITKEIPSTTVTLDIVKSNPQDLIEFLQQYFHMKFKLSTDRATA